jgi:hypothetical protein
MATKTITWTMTEAGRYKNAESGLRIRQGDSGRWFVYDLNQPGGTKLLASAAKLSLAKLAAKPFVLARPEQVARIDIDHAEALRMEAARIVEQDGEDALIHLWNLTSAPSACGVDILHTPYTFGSDEPSEVTCPVCLSTRTAG